MGVNIQPVTSGTISFNSTFDYVLGHDIESSQKLTWLVTKINSLAEDNDVKAEVARVLEKAGPMASDVVITTHNYNFDPIFRVNDVKNDLMNKEKMEKRIFKVISEIDLERCFPIMKELRPHLSYDDFLTIYNDAHKADGYEIIAIEENNQILALMGYRFLSDYVRGKHIYIDDLVTTEKIRSKGLGADLLKFAEDLAQSSGCNTLRLCTGIENERGVKFYNRNGWIKRAFAYTKKLK
ncbi:MAG: GNAT family N-acetyltransferase [Bacteriovoracaceae bacterium]